MKVSANPSNVFGMYTWLGSEVCIFPGKLTWHNDMERGVCAWSMVECRVDLQQQKHENVQVHCRLVAI